MGKLPHHVGFIVTGKTGVDGRSELDPRPEGPHCGYVGARTMGVGCGWPIIG